MENTRYEAGKNGRSSWRGRGAGTSGTRSRGRGGTVRGGHTNWRGSHAESQTGPKGLQPIRDSLGIITLAEVRASVRIPDLDPKIEDCHYVASFNWKQGKSPTILVPGAPPAWTPPKVIPSLEQDSGAYFRDINAAYYTRFPMEPAIRALFTMRPDFEATKIDVVGCGNTMGNLLGFVESSDRSFQFNIEVIGNTVFLIRKGALPKELIPDVRGYGHTYPEAYTSWDAGLGGSVSHQRLVKYRFGGLNCLLRCEGDGYLMDKAVSGNIQSEAHSTLSGRPENNETSSLLEKAGSLFVSEIPATDTNLLVQRAGKEIPQHAIFDIKTRSNRKELDMNEIYPRLWVGQIPNFIIAYHTSGKFGNAQIQDVRDDLKRWERINEELLRDFNTILRQLIEMAKQSKGQRIEVRRSGVGPLQIGRIEEKEGSALPPDLRAKWTGMPYAERDLDGTASILDKKNNDGDADEEEADGDDYLKF